jgi:hypothetical protein
LLLRNLIKLINGNIKIAKLSFDWGTLALKLRVALQIIIIIIIVFELGDFLPVKIHFRGVFYEALARFRISRD